MSQLDCDEKTDGSFVSPRGIFREEQRDGLLDHFFTLSPDLLCLAGTNGHFRRVNPAFEKLLGFPSHELQSKPFVGIVHPDDAAATARELKSLAHGKGSANFENRCRCKDGSYRWVAWRASTAVEDGLLCLSGRDLTEYKKREADSALMDTFLESSVDMVYFKDLQSRLLRYSRNLPLHFGLTDPDALKGKTDFDCYDEERARSAYEDEQRIIRTGEALVAKLETGTRVDGRISWVLTSKMPWRDPHGTILGTFGISKDVTALRQAQAELAGEKDLLQVLLNELPDTIYFKDLESRFVRVSRSKAGKNLLTLRDAHRRSHPSEHPHQLPAHLASVEAMAAWLIGKTDFDVMPEEHARVNFDEEQQIIRTGQPVIGRIDEAALPDGKSAWHIITKMPWRDSTGKIIGTYGTSKNITAMKEAEAKIEAMHKQLLETSRQAGVAEMATNVLHNVGNVLTSINVASSCMAEGLRKSKAANLPRVVAMLREHSNDLSEFLQHDPKGQRIPTYLEELSQHLIGEHAATLKELTELQKNIEHIRDIVTVQQNCARVSGATETIQVLELVEDALRMNVHSLTRHHVQVTKELKCNPKITVERHKVLQILVNLIRNARQACDVSDATDKTLCLRVNCHGDRVLIDVIDNGVGIPAENLSRIFTHGFTTKKDGHGFGLHSCSVAAREMGGELHVHSDGPGRGATFTLELPTQTKQSQV